MTDKMKTTDFILSPPTKPSPKEANWSSQLPTGLETGTVCLTNSLTGWLTNQLILLIYILLIILIITRIIRTFSNVILISVDITSQMLIFNFLSTANFKTKLYYDRSWHRIYPRPIRLTFPLRSQTQFLISLHH